MREHATLAGILPFGISLDYGVNAQDLMSVCAAHSAL